MPRASFGRGHDFVPRADLLTFQEITRVARIAVAHGVERIRLTGGEPLLRPALHLLVGALGDLRTPQGDRIEVALTTNGALLARQAPALRACGLRRVTVSLDSLDDATFRAANDARFPVARVLDAIEVARRVGLEPVKVNMVVRRGHNDHDVVAMARHFKDSAVIVRFIEYMDVGATNGWQMGQVVPSAEVVARIHAELPLEQVAPNRPGETAVRWRYVDGGGEIGVVSAVTKAFCHSCTRARLSADGKLFTCLFATGGGDLRSLMRDGCADDDLAEMIARIWRTRTDQYSADRPGRIAARPRPGRRMEMSYIGG